MIFIFEFIRPTRNSWGFLFLPQIQVYFHRGESGIQIGWLFWGISFAIEEVNEKE